MGCTVDGMRELFIGYGSLRAGEYIVEDSERVVEIFEEMKVDDSFEGEGAVSWWTDEAGGLKCHGDCSMAENGWGGLKVRDYLKIQCI